MTAPLDVEDVLRASLRGDADARAMFRALSGATLLVAMRPAGDGPAHPYVFEIEGAAYGAFFTSPERTAELPDAPDFVPMVGAELGRRWPDGLFAALNPGSGELARSFDTAAMRFLERPEDAPAAPPPSATPVATPGATPGPAAAPDAGAVRGNVPFAVGAPAQAPSPNLVDALRQAVRTIPAVEAGYLFQYVQPPDEPRLVAGVVVPDPRLEQDATMALARAVAARFPAAAQLDFLPLGQQLTSMVSRFVDPIA